MFERPECGRKPREADDRVQDNVRLRLLEQLREIAADLGQRSEPVDRLCTGRSGGELELRVSIDDLDRLPADRARSRRAGRSASRPQCTAQLRLSREKSEDRP